ncbi:MAG TPA: type II 3-dehydroquinate dehydratase [Thermodesulfobacteriota bacterium]|nr:type II 3-dehydroquinate dehydratase [Thermodesulfobacteriota bacterium]
MAARAILVIHGPNLNLLGRREPEIYGRSTLAEIDASLAALGRELGLEVESFQSNHEGAIVERIQQAGEARERPAAIIINPAAYGHTSVAIRDALLAVGIPAIEVHLSNTFRREPFRRRSLIADVAVGVIAGFGPESYRLALRAAAALAR